MLLYAEVILKLFLALILGGLVGFEREHKSRPAGLRTHILVCIGAALVQVTAINYHLIHSTTIMDPMRLGAQVISGIGFLGAGTILKEGATVKGLTTAASIWAVGCIGVAIGTGLYFEATAATLMIYFSLKGFSALEDKINRNHKYLVIEVYIENRPGMIGKIGDVLGTKEIQIHNIRLMDSDDTEAVLYLSLKQKNLVPFEQLMDDLMTIEGIRKIKQM